MNRLRFPRTLGVSTVLSILLLTASCNYGFQGGGGFPSDIRTLYVESFDNQTPQAELTQLLFQRLSDRLPRALGIRPAGQENADAIIRGRIVRYDDVGQNYRPGATQGNVDVLTYQVTITVAVELVDRKRNVVLWDSQSLVGRGEYRKDSQTDVDGRETALNHILQQIIDGAQSQW
jgi:outer membrane lipopolysaccharide assembly protein LptE/RlpB